MTNRSLPKPLGLSRVMPHDVVFDCYLSEQERNERLLAASYWVSGRLELFMPLSPPQKWCLERIMYNLTQTRNAIEVERAIVELIQLEEPVKKGWNKFGVRDEQ